MLDKQQKVLSEQQELYERRKKEARDKQDRDRLLEPEEQKQSLGRGN